MFHSLQKKKKTSLYNYKYIYIIFGLFWRNFNFPNSIDDFHFTILGFIVTRFFFLSFPRTFVRDSLQSLQTYWQKRFLVTGRILSPVSKTIEGRQSNLAVGNGRYPNLHFLFGSITHSIIPSRFIVRHTIPDGVSPSSFVYRRVSESTSPVLPPPSFSSPFIIPRKKAHSWLTPPELDSFLLEIGIG